MSKKDDMPDLQMALMNRRLAEGIYGWKMATLILAFAVMILAALSGYFGWKSTNVEVKYVEFTTSRDNFFKVHPANMAKTTRETLIRKQLRNYVYNRNRRDNISEEVRFREVMAMNTEEMKAKFKDEFYALRESLSGVDRDVVILSDSPISRGIHQIEFMTLDKKDSRQKKTTYVATLKYSVDGKLVNAEEELRNPMGLFIKGYSLAQRNIVTEGIE